MEAAGTVAGATAAAIARRERSQLRDRAVEVVAAITAEAVVAATAIRVAAAEATRTVEAAGTADATADAA